MVRFQIQADAERAPATAEYPAADTKAAAGTAGDDDEACRRYGLKPFREAGRRSTTIQVRAPKTFHDKTLWPEFCALADELDAHLRELTARVIREAIDEDVSEAAEAPKALPAANR
jgi:hypothetical protein